MLRFSPSISGFVQRRLIQTKSIARTFRDIPELLEFYEGNISLGVTQLEPLVSQIAFIQSAKKTDELSKETLFSDQRFIQLLLQASSDMSSCDSSSLSRFAMALSNISMPRGGCSEMVQLARSISEVACKRPNAFSPTMLSSLVYGLGTRGVSDPQFVEFVKIESLKTMQDFTPENAIMLLEGFRRMNVFDRELTDNVVERLTDEVDRFTARDIVNCVGVFSKLSLGRGFLLRRLTKLSFENLSAFKQGQLVKLFGGLARLRFTTTQSVDEMLEAIAGNDLKNLSGNQLAEVLFSVALSGYTGDSESVAKVANLACKKSDSLSLTALVDLAWALMALESSQHRDDLRSVLNKIYSIAPPSNRAILLKALEVTNGAAIEYPGLIKKETVSAQWKSAMDDAEKLELNRFENARLHSEVLALVESIQPMPAGVLMDKITLQRAAQVEGLYRVDFFDSNKNLAIDLDTLARPSTLVLKHRHLLTEGVAVVGLNYWELRRFKNFEEQQAFLKSRIKKALSSR